MKKISRSEAKSKGLKRYFTGKECVNGHIKERFVSNYRCVECCSDITKKLRSDGRYLDSARKWKSNNKSKVNAINNKRYTKKKSRTPEWLTDEDFNHIEMYYEQAQHMEWAMGEKYHVDHIEPLQGENVSGLHVPWNLQVITAEENLRKSNNEGRLQ